MTRRPAWLLACVAALMVSGCGSSGESKPDSHDATNGEGAQRASSQTDESASRVLIPAAVKAWPTERRESCDGYRPTHPRELLLVTRLSSGCSETTMLSSGQTVFLSVATGKPAEPEPRKDYDRWGDVDGKEVLVLARGDELRSAAAILAATVPSTGESAYLLGQPVADAWPYNRP